jgi:hypothetical protein
VASDCDPETSRMRRPRPTGVVEPRKNINENELIVSKVEKICHIILGSAQKLKKVRTWKSIVPPPITLQNDYKFFFVIDFGLNACSPLYLNIIIQIIKPSSTSTCKEQRVC